MSTKTNAPVRPDAPEPESPNWFKETPADRRYQLVCVDPDTCDVLQWVNTTREEYEDLKKYLADLRGLVALEDRKRYMLSDWKRDQAMNFLPEEMAYRHSQREDRVRRAAELNLPVQSNFDFDLHAPLVVALIDQIGYGDVLDESGSNWVGEFIADVLSDVVYAGPERANFLGTEMRDRIMEALEECYGRWKGHVEEMEDIEELYPGLPIVKARAADTNAEEPAKA